MYWNGCLNGAKEDILYPGPADLNDRFAEVDCRIPPYPQNGLMGNYNWENLNYSDNKGEVFFLAKITV